MAEAPVCDAAAATPAAAPPAPRAPLLGPASLPPFALERFFARHEFTTRHLLCCSDCEPLRVGDLLRGGGGGGGGADGGGDGAEALLAVRLGYTETRGDPELRAAIARHVHDRVTTLDPHRDLLTCVPQEGIFLAAAAMALRPGELVVATKPGYESLFRNPASAGARVLGWRPRLVREGEAKSQGDATAAAEAAEGAPGNRHHRDAPPIGQEQQRFAFDARDLAALLEPVLLAASDDQSSPNLPPLLRAVFVNWVCHNPTGFLATEALWRETAALLSRVDAAQRRRAAARGLPPPPAVVLFSDEMYAHMEPWREDDGGGEGGEGGGLGGAAPPIASALDLGALGGDNEGGGSSGISDSGLAVVALCGVSKSWGCPGLRIGWLAASPSSLAARALLDRASELRDYTTICSPGPCERLALAAVQRTAELTRAARARVRRNAGLAAAFFGGRWARAFEWPGPPDAGPVCFPAVTEALLKAAGARDVAELCERLAAESGVLLLPGTVYVDEQDDDDADDGLLRLDRRFRLGLGREAFEDGLAALDAWLVGVMGAPIAG